MYSLGLGKRVILHPEGARGRLPRRIGSGKGRPDSSLAMALAQHDRCNSYPAKLT